jgi:hypothetical protein
MVYLEPVHLGWQPLITNWKLKMLEREEKDDESIGLSLINFDQFCD